MRLRRVRGWLAAFFLFAPALGCGADRYIVVGSARAPSTAGYVEVSTAGDHATRVRVRMEALHPVDSLDPALHAYVVWFQPEKGTAVRAGSLHYHPDERVGELVATSPFRKFVVKITAEANDTPSVPSGFVVATQAVSEND